MRVKAFLRDEEAQATTEYILLLAIAVMLTGVVVGKFLRPLFAKLTDFAQQRIDRMFKKDYLHHLPIGG